MKTFETQFAQFEENKAKNTEIIKTTDTTKDQILNTLETNKISEDLAKIFWLNEEKINKLTNQETMELSDNMEVNKTTYDLANKFEELLWRNDISSKMISLNNKDYQPVKSYAWVA